MSEKDVYALFDQMFEQLENDDPTLQNTSTNDFTKIVNEKLDVFAKHKGFEDFNGMVQKYDASDLDESHFSDIEFKDKRDFLHQALVVYQNYPTINKYLTLIDDNMDLEELYELVKDEYLVSKDAHLKYILDAYDVYKDKVMKMLNDSLK